MLSEHRLRRAASALIAAASALPPSTTVIITPSAAKALSLQTPRLLRLSQSLRALSSLISDFRIFVRLWGLLAIWQWGSGVLAQAQEDGERTLRGIALAQVAVNVAFQALENGAYLASKGVLGWSTERQNRAWVWSSRFWAAHVGLDFWKLVRERSNRRQEARVRAVGRGEKIDVQEEKDERAWYAGWRKRVLVNMAWAPLTLHWSVEEGLISELGVGLFGSVAGVVGISELWKKTAV